MAMQFRRRVANARNVELENADPGPHRKGSAPRARPAPVKPARSRRPMPSDRRRALGKRRSKHR